MNGETIQQALVQYGPWMVIGVAVISIGLTAVVFVTFLLNELCFKTKDSHAADAAHGHGDHGHGSHH